jgi:tRNA 5-methylaminomethyl-2-thiouridine biosynthesis bifunctional protein
MSDDPPTPAEWGPDGVLRSRRHGDIYFSTQDGLAETRQVFLAGCGLPEAWSGRSQFTVGEIGFGTGLNVCALLELWRRERPANGRLNIFSIEAWLLDVADARRALGRWPELAAVAGVLLARWPGRARGLHRVDFPEWNVTLDVAVQEAGAALEAWQGAADAWFLDGFSPALNPDAWRAEVLSLVARRSRPGAAAATFTAAGEVRRGLAAAGFEVRRQPGFAGKRHRLEARLPGRYAEPARPSAVVVGAGIAGVSLHRALSGLGIDAALFDAEGLGAGATGNPYALVTPRLDAGLGPSARFSARAFARAVALYGPHGAAITARGVLQLVAGERDPRRFAAIAASDLFEPDDLALLTAEDAAALVGEPSPGGLLIRPALAIEPLRLLAAFAGDVRPAHIAGLRRGEAGWSLLAEGGKPLASADIVVLAAGWGTSALGLPLPLGPIRGQLSFAPGVRLQVGLGWGGHAAPGPDGLAFGATFDRDRTDTEMSTEDNERNRQSLGRALPRLAAGLEGTVLSGRASIRAVTPDREPVAGAIPRHPGLYALTGLGSRGFAHAPLLAEHIAALISGTPSPLAADQAEVVDPKRF